MAMPIRKDRIFSLAAKLQCLAIAVTLVGISPTAFAANDELLQAASLAAQEGRLHDMLRFHEQILVEDADNLDALAGKAAALAWQGRYRESQTTYKRLLELTPSNVDALVGLGYAYAWDAQYTKAHTEFNRALAYDARHLGARKGRALSFLWSGQRELALEELAVAASIAPGDVEIWEVAGYAHLEQHNNRRAIESFDRALELDPDYSAARSARLEAYRAAPAMEVFVQAGSTSDADSGLRMVEMAHWPTRSTRVFLRFDDTIGLDNPSISNRGESAYGYFAGASHQFNSRWQLHVEGGIRQLADGDLNSVTAKGVAITSVGALTLGAQIGHHELGYDNSLAFGSFRFSVAEDWYLEPALYLSETGLDGDNEWRGVLGVEYQGFDRTATGAFVGTGKVDALAPSARGETTVYGAWIRREFGGPFALALSARVEQTPTRNFNIFEIGFQYRLPGNVGGGR